ncbi:MAG: cysteine protease [Candidatus Methanoperedenaceae archaeon]|nr:cysteine protease [Candidatus Methanoperedenaceae archaeon]
MENQKLGMGWLPDYPDFRDYTFENMENEELNRLLSPIGLDRVEVTTLPSSVDLRSWCSSIENQGQLGSCTANAGAGVVEYFENRAFGRYLDASRLFLYKATRNFAKLSGDSGAFLRSTIGALALFGVPPEEYWPYTDKTPDFDKEPTAFCYSFAANYKSIKYFRHDPPTLTKNAVLESIKKSLAAGIPSMFGFTVFNSISQAATSGKIPFPYKNEKILGGHAIVAVGYDDNMIIKNTTCGDQTQGALLIRNSWGTGWGEKGYGWLPYEYILKEAAVDFWSILQQNWIDTGLFKV